MRSSLGWLKNVRGSVRVGLSCALSAFVVIPVCVWAAAPAWWSQRGVLDPARTPDDYAVVNQGQVKHIAKQAYEEMKAKGVVDPVSAEASGNPHDPARILYLTWDDPAAGTDDYSAVNLGQLKHVAKPFYDRLIALNHVAGYPWSGTADNYALANIGQVKNLFGFTIPTLSDTPANLVVVTTTPTTANLSWSANPGVATIVQLSFDNGVTWKTLEVLAPGVTHYTATSTEPLENGTFRVLKSANGVVSPETIDWMQANDLDPAADSLEADDEGDGLTNREEAARGTNPNSWDTDNDGVNDIADGWPRDPSLSPPVIEDSGYIVVPLGLDVSDALSDTAEISFAVHSLDNHGRVLFSERMHAPEIGYNPVVTESMGVVSPGSAEQYLSALSDIGAQATGLQYWSGIYTQRPVSQSRDGWIAGVSGDYLNVTLYDPNGGPVTFTPLGAAHEIAAAETIQRTFDWVQVTSGGRVLLSQSVNTYIPAIYEHPPYWGELIRPSQSAIADRILVSGEKGVGGNNLWAEMISIQQTSSVYSSTVYGAPIYMPRLMNDEGVTLGARYLRASSTHGDYIEYSPKTFATVDQPLQGFYHSLGSGEPAMALGDKDGAVWRAVKTETGWDERPLTFWNPRLLTQINAWYFDWKATPTRRKEFLMDCLEADSIVQFLVRNGEARSLSDFSSNWNVVRAVDVNDSGTILAYATPPSEEAGGTSEDAGLRAVLLVPGGLYPSSASEVSADDHKAVLVYKLGDGSESANAGVENSIIEWRIQSGSGTLSAAETSIHDGLSAVTLQTSTVAGDTYVVQARLKAYGANSLEQPTEWISTGEIKVVPGSAKTFTHTKSKESYRSDATDTVTIEVTARDQFDNLVADGTPLTWLIGDSDATQVTGGTAAEPQRVFTSGIARLTLRAPAMPKAQKITVCADAASATFTMPVERVSGTLVSSISAIDVYTQQSATLTASVNAADGTPVYWFSSSGTLSTTTGTVQNGVAQTTLQSTAARQGLVAATATVGDRLLIWSGEFVTSAPVRIKFENPVLVGGLAEPPPLPPSGQPTDPRIVSTGTISAPAFGGYVATLTLMANSDLVELTGVDANGRVTLDSQGRATFGILASGVAAKFGRVEVRVQINPEGAAYVEIVESTGWDHVEDFFGGLVGADTTTPTGVVTSIVGGYIIVGDVGAVVKNVVRNAGWSDTEPNNFEMIVAGAGLVSTFTGPGDGVVTAIRTIISRIGNSPLADVLVRIFKRIIGGGPLPTQAEEAVITLLRNDEAFSQVAKSVLTSDELFKAATRANDVLGEPFARALKEAATTNGVGIVTAQRFADTLGRISDASLAGLKNAPANQLDEALAGLVKVVDKGISPEALKAAIDNQKLYTATYTPANLLKDLGDLANATGLESAVKSLKIGSNSAGQVPQVLGRRFEIEAAAYLKRSGLDVAEITTRIADPVLGKTDIDIIIRDDVVGLVYYQVKSTYGSFGSLPDVELWVAKALKDLGTQNYDQIKYLIPTGTIIPPKISGWLASKGIDLITIPMN